MENRQTFRIIKISISGLILKHIAYELNLLAVDAQLILML